MRITLSPMRHAHRPACEKQGEGVLIDGRLFDFSGLAEGDSLTAEQIGSDWLPGAVTRSGGVLHLTLRLCHGPQAPQETLFPAPLEVDEDGPLPLPPYGEDNT